jgi:Xaa-Pro aminopeptidase
MQAHERDLVGQTALDYEDRMQPARLKRGRLERLREQMAAADLGALLIFDPVSVRYVSGVKLHTAWAMRSSDAYALVPREGPILIFGAVAAGGVENRDALQFRPGQPWDYFFAGQHVRESAARWSRQISEALDELGVASEPVGIDRLDFFAFTTLQSAGVELADGRVAIERAKAVKTPDELILLRQACAIADVGIWEVRQAIRPGITENELWAIFSAVNIKHGGEFTDTR